jgi:hypothetical protein
MSAQPYYDALIEYGLNVIQIDKIKVLFEGQDILIKQLTTLTDAKLKEVGLTQLGLRLAVLSVIENN